MDDALTHRAKYHPLADVQALVANTSNGRRTRVIVRRCKMYAALWDNLTDAQQTAAEYVYLCHEAMKPYSLKAMDYSRIIEPRGGDMPEEIRQWRKLDYFAWCEKCRLDGVSHTVAVDVCGEGASINAMSTSGHKRAKLTQQMHEALDVMARMKGWR